MTKLSINDKGPIKTVMMSEFYRYSLSVECV